MSVRYACPNCGTTIPGRPLFAFRRPPAEITCGECRTIVALTFSYRLFWCYGLSIAVLWLPLSIWMLSGDLGKLGRGEVWLVDFGAGLFAAVLLSFLIALPLTFALRPAPRREA